MVRSVQAAGVTQDAYPKVSSLFRLLHVAARRSLPPALLIVDALAGDCCSDYAHECIGDKATGVKPSVPATATMTSSQSIVSSPYNAMDPTPSNQVLKLSSRILHFWYASILNTLHYDPS